MLSLSPVRYRNRDRDCSVTKYFNDTIGMQSFARWQLCCIQIASECRVAIRQRGLGRGSSTTFCGYCGFYSLKHFIQFVNVVCPSFLSYRMSAFNLYVTFALWHKPPACHQIRCLSVTLLHPTQRLEPFRNISAPSN